MNTVQAPLAVAAALCLLLCSCAGTGAVAEDAEKPAKVAAPELVGRIASIQSRPRFVLIQSYGPWLVAPGSILTTQGLEGRTANLLATGESAGQYAAADIRAGDVEVGDAVYTLPDPSGEPAASTPLTPLQSTEYQLITPANEENAESP
jgi:hypothetical protein